MTANTHMAVQIEATFREERGRILAALISQLGDFPLAEDALQDTLVTALERWETDGVPRNRGAWLLTLFGDAFTLIALPWFVLQVTGSGTATASILLTL